MALFDKSGFLIIPAPVKPAVKEAEEMIVIKDCFCRHGHSLINRRVKFGRYPGIMIGVENQAGQKGLVALSPVCGDKTRVSIDMDLNDNELLILSCPQCGEILSTYAPCVCGGELVVMFTTPLHDFNNCVGVCNRVGCTHAEIKNEGQLMTLTSHYFG